MRSHSLPLGSCTWVQSHHKGHWRPCAHYSEERARCHTEKAVQPEEDCWGLWLCWTAIKMLPLIFPPPTKTRYYSGILTAIISHLPWRRPHGRAWVPSPQLLHTVDSPHSIHGPAPFWVVLKFVICSHFEKAPLPCWNQREIANGLSPFGGSRHHTTSSLLIAMKATKRCFVTVKQETSHDGYKLMNSTASFTPVVIFHSTPRGSIWSQSP